MEEFELKELLASFIKFNDRGNDILYSNFASFDTRLKIFIEFCENDKIMHFITEQLKGYDYIEWRIEFDRTIKIGGAKFILPINENNRLSLLYQILLGASKDDLDVPTFSILAFASGSNLSDCINDFNREITRPFIRDIGYRIKEIQNNIIGEDSQLISQDKLIIINIGDIKNSQLSLGKNIIQENMINKNDPNIREKL